MKNAAEHSQSTPTTGITLRRFIIGQALFLTGICLFPSLMNAEDKKKEVKDDTAAWSYTEKATLGGGCFWCTEAVFERFKGVKAVISGYAGGKLPNPTYKQICTGDTGHAEVIEIEFDPAKITYAQILEIFWAAHDPTTLNRQGADTGTQYRSTIMY
ncbi:MAG: msrA1, partial [Verrucomicrobia bacterium]|nr:msrA1 [Verrucomicrobiota bacterium]